MSGAAKFGGSLGGFDSTISQKRIGNPIAQSQPMSRGLIGSMPMSNNTFPGPTDQVASGGKGGGGQDHIGKIRGLGQEDILHHQMT